MITYLLCAKKAGSKLSDLSRISNYLNFERKRILLKAFLESRFGYFPLTRMFHSRNANSKMNQIQENKLLV